MRRLTSVPIETRNITPAIRFENCPAKTLRLSDGRIVQGHSVLNHCQIVGEIARHLIARFPQSIRDNLFPDGSAMVAAAHDIGKVSPTFVAKIFFALGIDYKTMPELSGVNPALEKQWGGHAGVSQATAEEIGVPKYVAEILGQHHGFNPMVDDKRGHAEVFGGNNWFEERKKLVEALKEYLHADWPTFDSAAQARIVAGLTSVADWIGSGAFLKTPAKTGNRILSLPWIMPVLSNQSFTVGCLLLRSLIPAMALCNHGNLRLCLLNR
ncbi:CRISPR-associated endonuclease Cas3'' [Mangrovibacter sp. SLW1]